MCLIFRRVLLLDLLEMAVAAWAFCRRLLLLSSSFFFNNFFYVVAFLVVAVVAVVVVVVVRPLRASFAVSVSFGHRSNLKKKKQIAKWTKNDFQYRMIRFLGTKKQSNPKKRIEKPRMSRNHFNEMKPRSNPFNISSIEFRNRSKNHKKINRKLGRLERLERTHTQLLVQFIVSFFFSLSSLLKCSILRLLSFFVCLFL